MAGQNETVQVVKVGFEETELLFEAANEAAIWRANTLYEKEPDTIFWLKQIQSGEVFVDIGANVGMYSVVAAKGRGANVFAFEPEGQNFALLNRNVVYNQIQDLVLAFPLALSNELRVDKLYLSQFGLGGSCHTFGESKDFHLNDRPESFAQGCVAMTLDQLVRDGAVPQPHHIKIDVDGLEHFVLEGASECLNSPMLKSVLVELNTHLAEHRELVDQLGELGFVFDEQQVEVAIRQEGNFAGIGNYIFYRPESGISFAGLAEAVKPQAPAVVLKEPGSDLDAVKAHVVKKFQSMDIELEPYPHFYVQDLFPDDYYEQMLANKPGKDEVLCINDTGRATGFDTRFVLHLDDGLAQMKAHEKQLFWAQHRSWFYGEDLMVELIKRFRDQLARRGITQLNVKPEAMFMRDMPGYEIGPHTDSPRRLLSLMVYLPEDSEHAHLGTSIYVPEEKGFTCSGVRHHGADAFRKVYTAPYLPNSGFGFFKTENSFHGVERMDETYERDTLVYIIKHKAQAQVAA